MIPSSKTFEVLLLSYLKTHHPVTQPYTMCAYLYIPASDGTNTNNDKVADTSALDIYGNALLCKCAEGFRTVTMECFDGELQSGACPGVSALKLLWGIEIDELRACSSELSKPPEP